MGGIGIGSSLFLIAAGAILRWAVTADVSSVDLPTVGLIVFAIGCAGLVISLAILVLYATRDRPLPPPDRDRTRPLA